MIRYDPDILEFIDRGDEGFVGSTGRQMNCPQPIIDTNVAYVQFGCGSIGETPAGPSGDGTLATARFKAKDDGTSDLVFLKADLANWNGDDCCGFPEVEEAAVAVGTNSKPPAPDKPKPDPARRNRTRPDGATLPPYEMLPDTPAAENGNGGSAAGNGTGAARGSGADDRGAMAGRSGTAGPGRSGGVAGAGTTAGATAADGSSIFPVAGYGQPHDPPGPLPVAAYLLGSVGLILVLMAFDVRRDTQRRDHVR
jgi:hypothetical protein